MDEERWPEGVDPNDGLDESECILIALNNNAAFQSELARLGAFRGNIVKAGEIANPTYNIFFPFGARDFESTLGIPLDFLWLRKIRLDIAQRQLDAEAESMLQVVEDLIARLRKARTQVTYCQRKLELAHQEARKQSILQDLAQRAFSAGGITGLESSAAAADSARAAAKVLQCQAELTTAYRQLWALLGSRELPADSPLLDTDQEGVDLPALEALKAAALTSRPDVRAASMHLSMAARQCDLSEREIYRLAGVIDADLPNGDRRIGPGIKFDIPLFNQGQGSQAQARAALEVAYRENAALRWQVLVDVTGAYEQVCQSVLRVKQQQQEILPVLRERATRLADTERAGLCTTREVVLAEVDLIRALDDLNIETNHLAGALIDLDCAVGCRCNGLFLSGQASAVSSATDPSL